MSSCVVHEITACRSCGSAHLEVVFDLGMLAVSDFPASPEEPLDQAPLTLVRCETCSLVQLRHTVERDRLYKEYHYRSGTNESMRAALWYVVQHALNQVSLTEDDTVWDIGANDGTLLSFYGQGVRRVGWEPARNLWGALAKAGCQIVPGYFPHCLPGPVQEQRPKVITSVAMFYDLDDPNAFVAAVKRHLHPEGIWVVQMMMLEEMVRQHAFDNICHEHLAYYSYAAFLHLIARHGLRVRESQKNSVNGGSRRFIVVHGEEPAGYISRPPIEKLQRTVQLRRQAAVEFLTACRRCKDVVLGYGASTKGNTLLQYYGIGPGLVSAIAERQPEKWGRYTVTGIPIISEEEMRQKQPDYLFVLPWHFIDNFQTREAALLQAGTKFLVPLPNVRVIGAEHANIPEKNAQTVARA